MRAAIALTILLLVGVGADAADSPVEVPNDQLNQWWIWTNAPAVNHEAQGYFVSHKVDNLDVDLTFTISTDGVVTDCMVVRKTDPEQPDDKLCDLISLYEYEPGKSGCRSGHVDVGHAVA